MKLQPFLVKPGIDLPVFLFCGEKMFWRKK